jgi:hypothetical protein
VTYARPEASLEQTFVKGLKQLKLESLKLNLQGQRGWPDRLVLVPGGRPVLIEFKRLRGIRLRALQEYRGQQLRLLGYTVLSAGGINEVRAALRLLSRML